MARPAALCWMRRLCKRAALLTVLLFAASVTTGSAAQPEAMIAWCGAIDVAAGGGHRGPWRQNDSQYDYVDDSTVAIDMHGAAAVAWVDQRSKDVFLQIFERDGKRRLRQPVNVSRTGDVFSWLPRIALSPTYANDVYVLWQEIVFSGGSHGGDIFFAASRDGGSSFGPPLNLSNSVAGDGKGRINTEVWHNGSLDIAIASDGTVYVAWTEYEGALWFSHSTDRGATFSSPVQVAGRANEKPARAPALAAGRDRTVHIAWTTGDDDSSDIRIARSDDGGRTFGEGRTVARTGGYSDAPKVVIDSAGTLHLVHGESVGGPFDRYDILYTRSRDGGQTFETPRRISQPGPRGTVSAAFPALSLDAKDNVYVLWELYRNHRELPRGQAFVVSVDSGNTYSAPVVVPRSIDPHGGYNGSQQGLLMRKLAVNGAGEIAIVNSSFNPRLKSRVWLTRGLRAGACAR